MTLIPADYRTVLSQLFRPEHGAPGEPATGPEGWHETLGAEPPLVARPTPSLVGKWTGKGGQR